MIDNIALRKDIISKRRKLDSAIIKEWSTKASEYIINSEAFINSKNIMVYNAINGELDLEHVISKAEMLEKNVLYPLCVENHNMKVLRPNSKNSFIKGAYGIFEPDIYDSVEYDPKSIDLCLCPMVAFDKEGNRIGMGGGYYDRFLPKCTNALIAGVAYEIQRVDRIIPNKWDKKMNIVFTDGGSYESI